MSLKIEDLSKYVCRNGIKPDFTEIELTPEGEPVCVKGTVSGEYRRWGWQSGIVKYQSSAFDLVIIKSINHEPIK